MKRHHSYLFPLCALLLTHGAAIAQKGTMRIFDLTLNAPFDRDIMACVSRIDFFDWCISSTLAPPRTVYLAPPETTERPIPTWAKHATVVRDDEERVVEIAVATPGVEQQVRVLRSLRERFGKPSFSRNLASTTLAGMKVNVTSALWKLPDAVVSHDCPRIDECLVVVQTPGRAAQILRDADQRDQRNKL